MKKDNKAYNTLLKQRYNEVCEEYLKTFCDMLELQYERDSWVAGESGTIACVGDMFFDFHDVIKYCVDEGITDYDEILRWYDYTLDCHDLGLYVPNFQSYHKGCPLVPKEKIDELRQMKKDIARMVDDINAECKQ